MAGVLIDITRALYRHMRRRVPSGIDRVTLEYVRHFGGRGRAVLSYGSQAAVLPKRASAQAFELLLNGAEREPFAGAWLMSRATLWDWMSRDGAGEVLVNTSHYGLEHRGYAARLRRRGARPVVFVHDLIPITNPEWCRPGLHPRHVARIRNTLATAGAIIVNSNDTLRALQEFAAAERVRCPPTLVAPLASCLPQVAPGPRPVAEGYFVILGSIEPRKNHLLVLRAWERIVERLGKQAAPRLMLIGQRVLQFEEVVKRCEALRGVVIERGQCSDAEIVTALHHARALLLPSFAEGFGIPAVEALSLGVPVLAADLPAVREYAGAVPEYFDPRDEDAWVRTILDYAAEPSARRAAQMERLAAYRPPNWGAHLRAVEEFLGGLAQ